MSKIANNPRLSKFKKSMKGADGSFGWPAKIVIMIIMTAIGFVFMLPILQMLSTSLMSKEDIVNPIVYWIPTEIYIQNFVTAFDVLGGWSVVFQTIFVMLLIAIAQLVSSAVIGYGFAKYEFWGKKLLFALVLVTFILPPQTTLLPKYVMFKEFGLLETIYPIFLPALFGQGISAAIFILLFYQFFKMIPKSLDEAAFIDGSGNFKTFLRINLPMAVPAIVVVFIFAFVWNWNETYLTTTYFGDQITTLPNSLFKFTTNLAKLYPVNSADNPILKVNEGIIMAGTLLTVLPLIVFYAIIERKLVESIDKAGITGE